MMFSCSTLVVVALMATSGNLAGLPEYTPDANAERTSIPADYLWDLSVLFPDDEAWTLALETTSAALEALGSGHDTLDRPEGLAAYMEAYFEVELATNRLSLYASLQKDGDTTSAEYTGRQQRALKLTSQVMDEGGVLRQAVLEFDTVELEQAYTRAPALETYRPWIESLRRRADRILDPQAERVLGLAGDNLWAAIDLNELPSSLETAFGSLVAEMPLPKITDADGSEIQLTFANYGRLRASDDRRVRRDTVAGMFSSLRSLENTFAATLGGQAKFDVFLARSRNYGTALEAYLDKDDLDPAVYLNLIDTVRAHAPALHRYVELRKKLMGLDEIHLYDLYVPMVEGAARDLTYAEGAQAICDALKPLGEDYYGPGYTIDADDPVEWAYIPHFYFKYYVFTYATGLASGAAIAETIATGDPAARDAYLEMLKGGNSKPPLELLKGAGLDLTQPDAIAAALELFDRTLTELEAILVKE